MLVATGRLTRTKVKRPASGVSGFRMRAFRGKRENHTLAAGAVEKVLISGGRGDTPLDWKSNPPVPPLVRGVKAMPPDEEVEEKPPPDRKRGWKKSPPRGLTRGVEEKPP